MKVFTSLAQNILLNNMYHSPCLIQTTLLMTPSLSLAHLYFVFMKLLNQSVQKNYRKQVADILIHIVRSKSYILIKVNQEKLETNQPAVLKHDWVIVLLVNAQHFFSFFDSIRYY